MPVFLVKQIAVISVAEIIEIMVIDIIVGFFLFVHEVLPTDKRSDPIYL